MAKLSKLDIKNHEEAKRLLDKDALSFEDKLFVFKNWKENAENINSQAGAFFTPEGLARDFCLEIYSGKSIVDLCSGIGILGFFAFHHADCEVTCIELNPMYYEVGKKLLPEATWINGSVFDKQIIDSLPKFNQVISNPPFGKIKTGLSGFEQNYKGSEFEFKVIEIASKIAYYGTFILPQMSTPYKYSGNNRLDITSNSKVSKFIKETGLEYEFNIGIDTSVYLGEWNGVSPMCEIVNFDFTQLSTVPEPNELKMF